MSALLSILAGCAASPEPRAEPVPVPLPVPTAAPVPSPTVPGATPCEARLSGTICIWMGIEGTAAYGPQGLPPRTGLNVPVDVEFGPEGTPYVIDSGNHQILVAGADGTAEVLLGSGVMGDGFFDPAIGTWSDGPAIGYKVNQPTALAFTPFDPAGAYVVARGNNRVLRYDFDTGMLEYWAGGSRGYAGDGGPASEASFIEPSHAVFDDVGRLYVMDESNYVLRRIDVDGIVSTVAGVPGMYGYNGDGPALEVAFHPDLGTYRYPGHGVAWRDGRLVFPDGWSQIVREYSPDEGTVTTLAGQFLPDPLAAQWEWDPNHVSTFGVGGYAGDGLLGEYALFNHPRDVAVATDGSIFVADTRNHCVRVIDPDGIVGTAAGRCGVRWLYRSDEDLDEDGHLDVDEVDGLGHWTDLDGDGSVDGSVEDLDGNGVITYNLPSRAHNLPATDAMLSGPQGVALDADGNLYIADTDNQVIRVVWR